MADRIDLYALELLVSILPELSPTVTELALDYDELRIAVVLGVLAEEVSALLAGTRGDDLELERRLEAVEAVAQIGGLEAAEAVGFGFFALLDDDALEELDALLGPASAAIAVALAEGELEEELEAPGGGAEERGRGSAGERPAAGARRPAW